MSTSSAAESPPPPKSISHTEPATKTGETVWAEHISDATKFAGATHLAGRAITMPKSDMARGGIQIENLKTMTAYQAKKEERVPLSSRHILNINRSLFGDPSTYKQTDPATLRKNAMAIASGFYALADTEKAKKREKLVMTAVKVFVLTLLLLTGLGTYHAAKGMKSTLSQYSNYTQNIKDLFAEADRMANLPQDKAQLPNATEDIRFNLMGHRSAIFNTKTQQALQGVLTGPKPKTSQQLPSLESMTKEEQAVWGEPLKQLTSPKAMQILGAQTQTYIEETSHTGKWEAGSEAHRVSTKMKPGKPEVNNVIRGEDGSIQAVEMRIPISYDLFLADKKGRELGKVEEDVLPISIQYRITLEEGQPKVSFSFSPYSATKVGKAAADDFLKALQSQKAEAAITDTGISTASKIVAESSLVASRVFLDDLNRTPKIGFSFASGKTYDFNFKESNAATRPEKMKDFLGNVSEGLGGSKIDLKGNILFQNITRLLGQAAVASSTKDIAERLSMMPGGSHIIGTQVDVGEKEVRIRIVTKHELKIPNREAEDGLYETRYVTEVLEQVIPLEALKLDPSDPQLAEQLKKSGSYLYQSAPTSVEPVLENILKAPVPPSVETLTLRGEKAGTELLKDMKDLRDTLVTDWHRTPAFTIKIGDQTQYLTPLTGTPSFDAFKKDFSKKRKPEEVSLSEEHQDISLERSNIFTNFLDPLHFQGVLRDGLVAADKAVKTKFPSEPTLERIEIPKGDLNEGTWHALTVKEEEGVLEDVVLNLQVYTKPEDLSDVYDGNSRPTCYALMELRRKAPLSAITKDLAKIEASDFEGAEQTTVITLYDTEEAMRKGFAEKLKENDIQRPLKPEEAPEAPV